VASITSKPSASIISIAFRRTNVSSSTISTTGRLLALGCSIWSTVLAWRSHDGGGNRANVGYPTLLQRANRAGSDWFRHVRKKLFERTEQFFVAPLNAVVTIASHRVQTVQVQNGNSAPADLNKPGILK
jgi:hypothetical protein